MSFPRKRDSSNLKIIHNKFVKLKARFISLFSGSPPTRGRHTVGFLSHATRHVCGKKEQTKPPFFKEGFFLEELINLLIGSD
ncbi:hypothetical protein MCI_02700 [Rickettsia montanensis str. OSU 85-930]|uniref:Uncharacterized protein n=1 Tax=Rickettsia montanensis (strain OSU 85-930) TaxID=1105114 RepID=H8KCH9_RICMS|nr:hypothetical protein MCI_02700 [Rickettsia montanensis str. OSU 85-930]